MHLIPYIFPVRHLNSVIHIILIKRLQIPVNQIKEQTKNQPKKEFWQKKKKIIIRT